MKERQFKGSVLVVDDEEDIRDIIESYLTPVGFDVDTAKNGLEAFEMIKNKSYDFLFTDLVMPVMNGFALIDNIISMGLSKLKIVVITASSLPKDTEEKRRILQKIVHGYIRKPFSRDDIYKTIENILSEYCEEGESGEDIEVVIGNYIKTRKIIDVIDTHGLELKKVVPVSYEDGYLECVTPGLDRLLQFNSIKKIVLVDESSPSARLFKRHDLHEEPVFVRSGKKKYDECSIVDYSYSGLGVNVPENFSHGDVEATFEVRGIEYPCNIVYYNKKLGRIGISFELDIGKEIVSNFNQQK